MSSACLILPMGEGTKCLYTESSRWEYFSSPSLSTVPIHVVILIQHLLSAYCMLDRKWWPMSSKDLKTRGQKLLKTEEVSVCKSGSAHRMRRAAFGASDVSFTESAFITLSSLRVSPASCRWNSAWVARSLPTPPGVIQRLPRRSWTPARRPLTLSPKPGGALESCVHRGQRWPGGQTQGPRDT